MSIFDAFSLKEKVAIVTGSSRGIGRSIALAFAEAGADVVVSSRKREACEAVAKEIEERGARSMVVPCHVGKTEQIENLLSEVKKAWGRVDVLVNNAATNPAMGALVNTEDAVWDKIMEINLRGVFAASRAAGRIMMEQGSGAIINVASTGGIRPPALIGAYGVSKAAVIHLTRSFAKELASSGVRVNCIAPGLIETAFASALINTPEIYQEALKMIPLGRHGQPDEIAGAALYLASDASGYVTGHIMVVDGGSTIG
ncbi:MAG: glucose 1-dehydrogenase [Deltaproteobacteria bacterium]|nr:glucose 1-dehydrogenase [Deltaproteobacteria bacterium]